MSSTGRREHDAKVQELGGRRGQRFLQSGDQDAAGQVGRAFSQRHALGQHRDARMRQAGSDIAIAQRLADAIGRNQQRRLGHFGPEFGRQPGRPSMCASSSTLGWP